MTTAELRAAAERIKRESSESLEEIYGDDNIGGFTPDECLADDYHRLADAYLTEHLADDDAPITLAWMCTTTGSFERPPGAKTQPELNGEWYFDFLIESTAEHTVWLRVHSPSSDGECPTEVYGKDFVCKREEGVGLVKSWLRTRGHLRRLAAALGIGLRKDGAT